MSVGVNHYYTIDRTVILCKVRVLKCHDSKIFAFHLQTQTSELSSGVIRRRNSPSPRPERPKSEISVRWADLVETTEITPVKRREGSQRNRPRPKSDLGM